MHIIIAFLSSFLPYPYCTPEIFGGRKFCQTIQVIAIGKEKVWQITSSQFICQYIFSVSVNFGEEILANSSRFANFANVFPRQNFPVYGSILSHAASVSKLP